MMESGLTGTDALALMNRDGGFGGDGNGSWLFIIVILALFGGFGGRGGLFGGNGAAGEALTQAELCQGFNFNNLESAVRAIQNGICDSTFALNNSINQGFNSLGMATMQGFNGVDKSLCALQAQQAACCCETNRNIDNVRFENERNTCNIIQASNDNTRAILDWLSSEKISGLQVELAQAQAQLSQNAQTQNIINSLKTPCPVPSYQVYPPTPVPVNYNCGGGCGCGY